jgi:FkbM family methyltransferase
MGMTQTNLNNRMFKSVKSIIARTPFSPVVKKAYRYYLRKTGKRHHIQATNTSTEHSLIRLGTEYGGWTFVDDSDLNNSIILSAGLGEDASFDIEFANKYDSEVIVIDPTPRAIQHFNKIIGAIGQEKNILYSKGGKQPVDAYELSNIADSQLSLIKKALWDEKTKIEFYKPEIESHVSHSITNWQHDYNNDTDHIEVQADTISSILESQGINKDEINLIKLDIEGAEIEVITYMMENKFYPKQMLVEFDELHNPSERAFERVDQAHGLLLENGYELIYTDGIADFLYHRSE